MRLLIVEDNKKISDLLALFARQDGHETFQESNAEDALLRLAKQAFDVILTDLMLPDMQGEALIQRIRQVSDVYIMVLSAKIDLHDRLDVLSLGADDYLTKPFSVEEVMAKLKNVTKRLKTEHPILRSFRQGELLIKPMLREVWVRGELVTLTSSEYDVLWQLLSHPNRIFTRDELLAFCFTESDAFDRVIDAFVKNIRKKIGDDAIHPHFIKTHYGIGYQFVGEQDD